MTKKITRKTHNRLNGYDYSQPNYYYITTCTENHKDWFGVINNNQMILNSFGLICREHLQKLPDHYKNIEIDKFIIMPNHVHAIITINYQGNGQALGLSLHNDNNIDIAKNEPLSKTIRDFKSFSSREINKTINNGNKFKWQRSFHDHIIRNETSLNKIREYIATNPATWYTDEYTIEKMEITKKIHTK
ncbi:MAG: transposase [PVC group bacterium]|nr:transposase [PVC group bacterium]